MIRTNIGATLAALAFSIAIIGALHFALAGQKAAMVSDLPGVSAETTASIPR